MESQCLNPDETDPFKSCAVCSELAVQFNDVNTNWTSGINREL